MMSHPPVCLAASPTTQTPVSRVSPEPCLLHPFHVVSVWAGAGGRAWLCLGGRLGPGVGTGPQPQGCSYSTLFSVFRFQNTVSLNSDIDASVQNIVTSDKGLVYEEEIKWCSEEISLTRDNHSDESTHTQS